MILVIVVEPLSKEFLLNRGVCCGSKCHNCPYYPKHKEGVTSIKSN